MAKINVELISPFVEAAQTVLKNMAQIDSKVDKPYLTNAEFEGEVLVVIVGITGEMKGQVIIDMNFETACAVASNMMMGMPVPELNDMAKSAISELCNMILGNSATLFSEKGIVCDITPPSICLGNDLSISVSDAKTVCIPLVFGDGNVVEVNVAVQEN